MVAMLSWLQRLVTIVLLRSLAVRSALAVWVVWAAHLRGVTRWRSRCRQLARLTAALLWVRDQSVVAIRTVTMPHPAQARLRYVVLGMRLLAARHMTAATGRSSFAVMSHRSVMTVNAANALLGNPHRRHMSRLSPSPTAPPQGTMLDTALPAILRVSAWGMVRPGRPAVRVKECAQRLVAQSPRRSARCPGVIFVRVVPSSDHEVEATWGTSHQMASPARRSVVVDCIHRSGLVSWRCLWGLCSAPGLPE